MSLPLVKLASLAVKTASKPLANRIKSQLKESPVWQGRALSFMQWYHRTSINAQRSMAGYSDDKEVKPMSETRAVSEFADMVGEGFVFGVALALVIWENSRKASSDDKARKAGLAADKDHNYRLAILEAHTERTEQRLENIELLLLKREEELEAAKARRSKWFGFSARTAT